MNYDVTIKSIINQLLPYSRCGQNMCQVEKMSNLYKNINDHLIIWLPIIFFASFILITEL